MTEESAPAAPLARPLSRWQRCRAWMSRLWQRTLPPPGVQRGARRAALLLVGLVAAALGATIPFGLPAGLDYVAGPLFGLAIIALVALAAVLAVKLIDLVRRFLGLWGIGALVAAAVLLFLISNGLGMPVSLAVALGLVIAAALAGGAVVALRGGASPRRRALLAGVLLLALAGLGAFAGWLFLGTGEDDYLVKEKPMAGAPAVAALALPDPGARGPYAVKAVTYGSGTDRRRREFGAGATWKSPTVDGTPFVKGNEGWRVKLRDWYWGFGFKKWPLNARVWMPEGPGPFPLALIVHGNHDMADYSDPGYAYLGEHLASRGIILASVDENFVNGSWVGGLDRENDARGWLLLKHLELWRRWNADPKSPVHGKVDLDRLAVMGHSRGGEAAVVAACFNRLARYPDDANVRFDFNFHLRAVVAIAPIDGQYKPAGRPTPFADVDYLLLQGAHDGDVSFFSGDRAFRRLRFTDGAYHFKTSLYEYRANHGQFNTVWGNADAGWPQSFLLNRKGLMPGPDQRRVGLAEISAFFAASLQDRREYLPFLRDPRRGAAWLPKDLRISRFEDSTFRPLADFEEEGVDVTAATLPGARIDGQNLAEWNEEDLVFRGSSQATKQNEVVRLGWKHDPKATAKVASYTVTLPAGAVASLAPGTVLSFAAADTGEKVEEKKDEGEDGNAGKPKDGKGAKAGKADEKKEKAEAEKREKEEKAKAEREKKEGKTPLDWTVELVDGAGRVARLPLSRFRPLPVSWVSRFTRVANESKQYGKAWEITLQTFELPLADFAAAAPGFDPTALSAIRFRFDRSPEGVVVVDNIGLAAGVAPSR